MPAQFKNQIYLIATPLFGSLLMFALAWGFFLPIVPAAGLLELAARQHDLAHQIVAGIEQRRSGIGDGEEHLAELAAQFDHVRVAFRMMCPPPGAGLTSGVERVSDELAALEKSWASIRLALSRPATEALPPAGAPATASIAPAAELQQFLDAANGISSELEESRANRAHLLPLICAAIAFSNGMLLLIGVWIANRHLARRRRAEDDLRESQGRYQSLVESTSDAIVVSDHRGTIVSWNRGATTTYGYTVDEALGNPVTMIMNEREAAQYREMMGEIASRGASPVVGAPFEVEGVRKDGEVFPLELTVTAWSGAAGERFIGAIVRDISARKREGQDVVRLAQAVEQATEAIVITATDGRIVYVNPAFERVSGYSRAEVVGQTPRILKSGRQDATFYREMWAALLRGEVWSGQLVNRRKDGTLYQEFAIISPVRDTAGDVINYVAVKRDISQEVALERQLRQSQKMEAIGRLAGGVAHDFNNLLTAIMGYGQMLQPKLQGDPSAAHELDEVLKAAGRAGTLTRQLLAFSRQQVLEPKVVNVNTIVTDIDKMLRRLIGEDVDLVTHAEPDLGSTRVDPGQIEQVIVNLVVNARDAMPAGGRLTIETANIEIGPHGELPDLARGRYVMIAVSDTGMGMPPEVRARLFEPFFTTKESGKGTGLGLSTVHGIVKQSGGDIEVYTELGQGSTFKIYLPRIEAPVDAPAVAAPEATGGSETLLVVEDDESIRNILRRSLEAVGYTVLEAGNGEAAIALCESGAPIDLLVTDVVMPRMSGPEVARQVMQRLPSLKVLFISGYADRALIHQGLREPGTAFLQKPFTPQILARKVRETLDQPLEKAA